MDETDQTIYCTECGAELMEGVSFCSECGTKIEDTNKKSLNNKEKDELIKEADKIVNRAEGPIIPEMLIQLEKPQKVLSGVRSDEMRMLYDKPLISYIDSDEQLDYLLNSLNGFRITEPDGTERTPHHGKRFAFLMITDKRLIYVAAQDGEDHVIEFRYPEIKRIELMDAFIKSDKIEFYTNDGYKYRFAPGSVVPGRSVSWRSAVKYIRNKSNAKKVNTIGRLFEDFKRWRKHRGE